MLVPEATTGWLVLTYITVFPVTSLVDFPVYFAGGQSVRRKWVRLVISRLGASELLVFLASLLFSGFSHSGFLLCSRGVITRSRVVFQGF